MQALGADLAKGSGLGNIGWVSHAISSRQLPKNRDAAAYLWVSKKRLLDGPYPVLFGPSWLRRVAIWTRKPARAMTDVDCDLASV